ncbi:MAG: chromate transporter [Pleurocapsa sp. SU_196_0]|nr:chromate transporter [Pleurocapsa sp. SU_196_0]
MPGSFTPGAFEIFRTFLLVGATAFGGGGSAHIQNAVVTRRAWLSEDDFLEAYTLAQTLPGPVFSNLAVQVGSRLAGWRGGVAAMIGVSLPGATLILLLATLYANVPANSRWLQGVLTGVGAGAVGISLSMLVRILPSAAKPRGGVWLALAAFIANAVLHVNILWVLAILLPLGIALNWSVVNSPPSEITANLERERDD